MGTVTGERWVRGRGEIYQLWSFFIALDLCNPWTSDFESHTTPFFFYLGIMKIYFFLFILSFKKNVLDRCSFDQLCMSAVQCLRRAGGFWQFVEPLLRMEQKRQDDLACNEEPWCPSGSDSSDRISELDCKSEVSDFPQITATIDPVLLLFLVVRTCWLRVM